MQYTSLQTIEQTNGENLLEAIRLLDPELYLIKIALLETGINPLVLVHVVRSLGNLTFGAGYGKVQIYMQAKVVTDIEATEKVKIQK